MHFSQKYMYYWYIWGKSCTFEESSPISTLIMQLHPGTCPFPVLGFWGKITMPDAGTMADRRYFPSTIRIKSTERGTVQNRVSGLHSERGVPP